MVVATNEIDVRVVVAFEKVNVNVKLYEPNVGKVVVYQVVTVTAIRFNAGALGVTRTPSAARVMQTITRALTAFFLFKSVPSRCWV